MIQEAEAILARLHNHAVAFVIIGGMCNVLHGVTLVTKDVDVCCPFEPDNLRCLAKALDGLHPVHRLTPNRLPLVLDERLERELKNLYLRTDLGILDCLSEVAGVGSYERVLEASVPVGLSFGECRMLSLDALIRAKEAIGREQDLLALRQLRAIRERRAQNLPRT